MVKFQHAKLTAGEEARALILSWQFSLSSFHFLSFFLFFSSFSFLLLVYLHDQTRTLTQTGQGEGVRRDEEGPKGDREQFTSLDLWITD